MSGDVIRTKYFNWMCDLVAGKRFKKLPFVKLLTYLHETPFTYDVLKDQNREADGIDLRYRYAVFVLKEKSPDFITDNLQGPCSVFEMMVALALRCEETIMDDPQIGDRTGQWFWGMIVSLGLGGMFDDRYDELLVRDNVEKFLNREYAPDGTGGLFTIKGSREDLREVEIWTQLCWYLNRFI